MLRILYSDEHIAVCLKPEGISSADEKSGMPFLIKEQLGLSEPVRTVHRLDNAVGGVMVYALNRQAAARLSEDIAGHAFEKRYMAVVHGCPEEPSGRYDDLLFHDSSKNRTYVVKRMRKGVRDAALEYEVKSSADGLTLVEIRLLTGRTHQIRAQFSSRKMPLAGDGKYGAKDKCSIALWSYSLSFAHPVSGERMTFSVLPPKKEPWERFDIEE